MVQRDRMCGTAGGDPGVVTEGGRNACSNTFRLLNRAFLSHIQTLLLGIAVGVGAKRANNSRRGRWGKGCEVAMFHLHGWWVKVVGVRRREKAMCYVHTAWVLGSEDVSWPHAVCR